MKRRLFNFILFFGILLSACSLPVQSEPSAPRAWIDAPLPGTVIRPPNPCQIVAHGASLNGIAVFELSVNGAVTASIPSPDKQGTLVRLTQNCGLSAPGRYRLQLRALDKTGNWSNVAETNLTIVADETPTAAPPTNEAAVPTLTITPTLTPVPTPTSTPTTQPTGSVSIEQISTNLVYLGGASCGPLNVTITARATAPKGIKVVVLFYRFQAGSASSEFQSVAMSPIGGELYQYNLNPTTLLSGSIPFDQAALQYQIVVQQNDDDTFLRTQIMTDIAVKACGNITAACSTYIDKRSCEAHGCNWASKPGIVPIYVCQNP